MVSVCGVIALLLAWWLASSRLEGGSVPEGTFLPSGISYMYKCLRAPVPCHCRVHIAGRGHTIFSFIKN